jgi:ribosomal protein S18 acetylase RimI-like enzyme
VNALLTDHRVEIGGSGLSLNMPIFLPDSVENRRREMISGVTSNNPAQVRPRRATEQDVAALVHLRSLMFSSMGTAVGGQDAAWRVAAAEWLREQLIRPLQFAGFVVEHPVDGVVCAALGSCDARAPSPNNVSGSQGHVFNICTEPAHRRSGYAQACLGALLTWFHTDTGVRVVHLNATPEGVLMYRAAGFREPAFPSMRLQLDRLTES